MWTIKVSGVVQGVGFRPAVKRAALKLGSVGFVRNDGSHVTIGIEEDPEGLIEALEGELGPMARMENIEKREGSWEDTGVERPDGFEILGSKQGERDSSLPCDTAICDPCLGEMLDPSNRRFRHPFTNCTDCGARYTIIRSLPYDRERTTMEKFHLCGECSREYSDHTFRRFHAQTLSCPEDGPGYVFLDSGMRERSRGRDSFIDCARAIRGKGLLIVKGWGGMHIVSGPGELPRLREWYGRPYKPFALMAKDLDTARGIARVDEYDSRLLSSPARPIVLLRKRDDIPDVTADMLETASPGLDSIGLYLPYSGIHHLLFRALGELGSDLDILVMTSANPPGEPMALDLGSVSSMNADGYFIHDREIAARCDDSVVVPLDIYGHARASTGPFSMQCLPVRKARGMVPDPLDLPHDRTLLSLGAERNVTVSVSRSGRVFTSPYIGNSRNPQVLEYASWSADRFRYLFGADDIEGVVIDRHPRYATRSLGRSISGKEGVPLIEVQHHHAHAASLMVDAGLEALTTIVVDGVGHGDDGLPWGGEILRTDHEKCERIGHLEEFGLPGGDGSVYHPERIAYWLSREAGGRMDLGDERLNNILDSTHDKAIRTTSLGRVLDALSALMLGVTWRSYDGEPAMRLERLLSFSKDPLTEIFQIPLQGGVVNIKKRWKKLIGSIGENAGSLLRPGIDIEYASRANLCMGFVASLIDDMVSVSLKSGCPEDGEGRPLVGISGGVAYDVPIVKRFVGTCRELGARPVLHSRVPPGDGGISVGQALIGGQLVKVR